MHSTNNNKDKINSKNSYNINKTEKNLYFEDYVVNHNKTTLQFDSIKDIKKDEIDAQPQVNCVKCNIKLEGLYVNAFGAYYHLNCFTCIDCKQIITTKFIGISSINSNSNTKKKQPLCEKDYYKRLLNKCYKCKEIIDGPHVTVNEKRFHEHHFECYICHKKFEKTANSGKGEKQECYELDDKLLCSVHYHAILSKNKCFGCNLVIKSKFVENKKQEDNNSSIKWHPECYMINKFWNIKLGQYYFNNIQENSVFNKKDIESNEEKDATNEVLVAKDIKIDQMPQQIWSVLSSYEESAASSISELLINISNNHHEPGIRSAERFVMHIEILFNCINNVDIINNYDHDKIYYNREDPSVLGIDFNNEPKILIDKIIEMFELLSKNTEANETYDNTPTPKLLTLITGVAHYLKGLIRMCLIGALKIDKALYLKANNTNTSNDFHVSKILKMFILYNDSSRIEQWLKLTTTEARFSDIKCYGCKTKIETECIKANYLRFHKNCLICNKCKSIISCFNNKFLTTEYKQIIHCEQCLPLKYKMKIKYVSKYDQYAYILRISLKEFTNVFKKMIHNNSLDGNNNNTLFQTENNTEKNEMLMEIMNHDFFKKDNENKTLKFNNNFDTSSSNSQIHKKEKEPLKNNELQRKEITSLKNISIIKIRSKSANKSILDKDIFEYDNTSSSLDLKNNNRLSLTKNDICTNKNLNISDNILPLEHKLYMSYLSVLESFIIKHLAVLSLYEYVNSWCSFDYLLELIGSTKKTTNLWAKFRNGLKQNRKKTSESIVFGAQLSVLNDRTGCLLPLGVNGNMVTIPKIVSQMISALQVMEGIFRKNGNIKRLKELSEYYNLGINVNLIEEGPIQTAALLKKFLRDMPDSLTVCKFYNLYTKIVQKIQGNNDRKAALHLVCCMLPSCNRDLLEALLNFVKIVSVKYAEKGKGQTGNRMDIHNMATVIAPNILYPANKETNDKPSSENESKLGIRVVELLIENIEEFSQVPSSVANILKEFDFAEEEFYVSSSDNKDIMMSPKDVLKKCQAYMDRQKSINSNNT